MKRREALLAAGTVGVLTLAGCTEEGSGDDHDDDSEDDAAAGDEDDMPSDDDAGEDDDVDDTEDDVGDADDGDEAEVADDDDGEDDDDQEEEEEDEPERSDATEMLSLIDTLGGDEPLFDAGTETFTGDGDSVTDGFSLGGALTAIVTEFEDEGMENYQAQLEGEADELLVNALEGGTFAGAIPTPNGDYLVDIGAPGGWEMTVGQPLAPDEEIRTLPVEASGEGPDVVGPVELDGGMTVSGEHDGERNFQVHIYDEDDSDTFSGELVFNEIGEYSGEERASYSGICWIDVEADGAWQLEIEE